MDDSCNNPQKLKVPATCCEVLTSFLKQWALSETAQCVVQLEVCENTCAVQIQIHTAGLLQ